MTIIAFPGKGGTGKTTLSALAMKYFIDNGDITFAMDLDPDGHLYKLLGIPIKKTLGEIVDRIHKEKKTELEPQKPIDISDQEYFLSLIAQEVIVEGDDFDLLTLGKPSDNIDCYCPSFLWAEYAIPQILKSYGLTYNHVVVDCDPGTEIFPRKILDQIALTQNIDHILIILDGSKMSIDTAGDIIQKIRERNLKVSNISGICNRVDDGDIQKNIRKITQDTYNFDVVGFIPNDPQISKRSLLGQSILDLHESVAYQTLYEIMKTLKI